MRSSIKVIIVLVVLAVLGVAAWWFWTHRAGGDVSFRTSPVTRGDLVVVIDATGTVEPEEVVDVGAQVAGLILSFGADAQGQPVNYGSTVKEGMILAQIDDSVYKAQALEADAQVAQAEASIQRAEADLLQMKAKLVQAQNDWERAEKLGPSEALAQTSYDAYKSAFETAKANVAIDEAAILQAKATRDQNVAAASRAHRNLSYCTITSPVDGVVIDRRVNIGQTVVASLNAPSLFLIAKDLKRMQIWVPVNEADIGRLKPGMPVAFTVEAFPGETFHGTVGRVRLNAAMTQNVVTYTVEVVADNSNNRLLPYLTANVHFELDRKSDVLQVASGALRWQPQTEQIAPEYRAKAAEWLKASSGTRTGRRGGQNASMPASGSTSRPGGRRHAESSSGPAPAESGRGVVWVVDGKFVRPIRVQTGLTDGSVTEIAGEDIKEGMDLIIGALAATAADTSGTNNPFAPPPRFGPPRPANAGATGGAAGGAPGAAAGGAAGGAGGGAAGAGRGAGGGAR